MKKLFVFLLQLPLFAVSVVIDSGSASDQNFVGGSAFTIATPGAIGDLTSRFGSFGYRIPAPVGIYKLTLVFRETGTVTASNQRIFSVRINDQLRIDRFDLFAAAGLASIRRDFIVINDGMIKLDFSYTFRSAVVSSIELTPWETLTFKMDEPGLRQSDGTYRFTGSVPTMPVMNVTVYRNGLKQNKYLTPNSPAHYSFDPNDWLRVIPNPQFPWLPTDVVTMEYEFRSTQ